MKSRLILIFAGLVFFFNPDFYLFDILPDFIGAILVMSGLSGFIYFDGNFEGAYKSAKYLLWFSLLKLALCMWCISNHRDYIMPFTFIFAVLEIIFMISMYRSLYLGAEYTLMRSASEKTPKHINEAFTMSFIFAIVSRVLAFAPQIADIVAQDAELDLSHKASFKMSMAQMKMYLLGTALVCGIIVGVIYLVMTAKAWICLIKDKEYNSFLKGKYEDYLRDEREAYVTKRLSYAYLLITVSAVFIPDFYVDGVNLIPSFITVICAFACARVVNSLMGKRKSDKVLFICAFASCAVNALYMSKVRLGINYICAVETFNREAFPFLESGKSVIYAGVFSFLEALLTWALIGYALDCFKKCFMEERRKNAFSRLVVCRVLSAVSLGFLAVSRTITCLCGFLATNPVVTDYVKNKAFITSGKVYEQMMANPYIQQYEKYVGVQSVIALLGVVFAILLVVVLVNMKRATEGNDKEIG